MIVIASTHAGVALNPATGTPLDHSYDGGVPPSGYLTTAGGEQLVLSILVNDVPTPRERTSLIDDIVVNLANFNGKIDQ